MNRSRLLSSLTLLLLAGCADYQLATYGPSENFLTFTHPFTDQAAADVLASARQQCLKRGQATIQTSRTCSLEKCTTNYQCVDSADPIQPGKP
jgi:hypothetical protein